MSMTAQQLRVDTSVGLAIATLVGGLAPLGIQDVQWVPLTNPNVSYVSQETYWYNDKKLAKNLVGGVQKTFVLQKVGHAKPIINHDYFTITWG